MENLHFQHHYSSLKGQMIPQKSFQSAETFLIINVENMAL